MNAENHRLTAVLDRVQVLTDRWYGPPCTDEQLAAIAALPGARDQLAAVIRDAAAPMPRRLAAVAALDQLGWPDWHSDADLSRAAATVLAWGLAHDRTHNRWGMPDAPPGYAGRLVVTVPVGITEAFAPLATDDRPLVIDGSESATINTRAGYTVGDLVTSLLSHRDR